MRRAQGVEFACPALPPLAHEAMREIEKRPLKKDACLIGSSLGGFYATYLAEKHGLKAVLLNPAIDPHVGLRAYLGPQKNLHTGEPYELTEAHLKEWEALYVPRITPQRYLLLVETGDEVLDYRQAVARYAGAEQVVVTGRRPQPAELPAAPAAHTRVRAVQLLYEEDGELKVGAVLERSPASFHVESPHGRRSKIKAANVLLVLRAARGGGAARRSAKSIRRDLEIAFLWECSGAREFGFQDLAREYVGPRADAGRGGRGADEAACGADVFLPARQGSFPGGAGGDAQARARRGREEEARAGAGRRLGRARWRAATARPKSPR